MDLLQRLPLLALLALLAAGHGAGFFWSTRTNRKEAKLDDGNGADDYKERIAGTGRVLVTMLGYPQRCERKGQAHVCALAVACWLAGGAGHAGCGANSWVVTCCVIAHAKQNKELHFEAEDGAKPQQLQQRKAAEDECGLSADRALSKRIIGGAEARFAQFPWQAHLKILTYQCGGVLVSRKYVATAAHCIARARLQDIAVYLGELDTQDTGKVVELAPAELHRVKRKIVHPSFEPRATQPDRFDLALLQMVTPAGAGFHIAPICLPPPGLQRRLHGRQAVVAGWGKVRPSNALAGTNVLRSARVPILSRAECYAWHTSRQIVVELHDDMLCAGHEDGRQDACMGDSGGPLIVLERGRWTLAGITSAGFGCGEHRQPGIYHSVGATSQWIRKIISKEMA